MNYIDKNELLQEIIKSQQQGKMTERLAELCIMIGEHMLKSKQYYGYSKETKEDMLSHGCLFCIRYLLKNYDPQKQNNSPFAYITTIFKSAYMQELNKYYKIKEFESELLSMLKNIDIAKEIEENDDEQL